MIRQLLGALFLTTATFSQSLTRLHLPQPQEVIIRNMEPEGIVAPRQPTTKPPSLFGRILLSSANILGASQEADLPPSRRTRKPSMTIAIIGDSMVDTMGTGLPYLTKALRVAYPETRWQLLNYGVGSTNINSGPERLIQPFAYQDRAYSSVTDLKPDLVIIESFAYNPIPLSESSLQHHAGQLTSMVTTLRSQGITNIMFLVTIAPHHQLFGTGPQGVNWSAVDIAKHTEAIHAYLENTLNTGRGLSVPVIDAFHSSQDGQGNGQLDLINSADFIHPSILGQEFIANTILKAIVTSHILE